LEVRVEGNEAASRCDRERSEIRICAEAVNKGGRGSQSLKTRFKVPRLV
jgi:hypothetical protein